MKNIFNRKVIDKKEFCQVCGAEIVNVFCNTCNKYISPEKANEHLKEKYPHIKKCEKCRSRKIVFSTEDDITPVPKNFLDKFAINLIYKYDEKYPQKKPLYREVAKCNKCGNKWYIDGYRDNNKAMLSLRKWFIIIIVVLIFSLFIAISSVAEKISENFEEQASESTTEIYEDDSQQITDDQTEQTIEDLTTEDVDTTEITTENPTTESTTVETTTEQTTETTVEDTTTTTKRGRTVYVTPYGEKYHCSADCAGNNAINRDYNDVKDIYEPCQKCAY